MPRLKVEWSSLFFSCLLSMLWLLLICLRSKFLYVSCLWMSRVSCRTLLHFPFQPLAGAAPWSLVPLGKSSTCSNKFITRVARKILDTSEIWGNCARLWEFFFFSGLHVVFGLCACATTKKVGHRVAANDNQNSWEELHDLAKKSHLTPA